MKVYVGMDSTGFIPIPLFVASSFKKAEELTEKIEGELSQVEIEVSTLEMDSWDD